MTQRMNEPVRSMDRFLWLAGEFDRRVAFTAPSIAPIGRCVSFFQEDLQWSDLHLQRLMLRKMDYWSNRRPTVFGGMRMALDVIDRLGDIDCDERGGRAYTGSPGRGLNEKSHKESLWRVFDQRLEECARTRVELFRLEIHGFPDLETAYLAFCEGFRSTIEYVFGSVDREISSGDRAFVEECVESLHRRRGAIVRLFRLVSGDEHATKAA